MTVFPSFTPGVAPSGFVRILQVRLARYAVRMEDGVEDTRPVSVRMFGNLRRHRTEAGLPFTLDVSVSREGISARELAVDLGLPCDEIEGAFVNHIVYDLDHAVLPGDEVAYVPYGTPGPHRLYLGLYKAGKQRSE